MTIEDFGRSTLRIELKDSLFSLDQQICSRQRTLEVEALRLYQQIHGEDPLNKKQFQRFWRSDINRIAEAGDEIVLGPINVIRSDKQQLKKDRYRRTRLLIWENYLLHQSELEEEFNKDPQNSEILRLIPREARSKKTSRSKDALIVELSEFAKARRNKIGLEHLAIYEPGQLRGRSNQMIAEGRSGGIEKTSTPESLMHQLWGAWSIEGVLESVSVENFFPNAALVVRGLRKKGVFLSSAAALLALFSYLFAGVEKIFASDQPRPNYFLTQVIPSPGPNYDSLLTEYRPQTLPVVSPAVIPTTEAKVEQNKPEPESGKEPEADLIKKVVLGTNTEITPEAPQENKVQVKTPDNSIYFNQLDPSYKNEPCWYGPSGCGPTTIAMVLSRFGESITPPEVARIFSKRGIKACGNTDTFMRYGVADWLRNERGFEVVEISAGGKPNLSDWEDRLNQGYLIVMSWQLTQKESHIAFVSAVNKDTGIAEVADPLTRNNDPQQIKNRNFLYALAVRPKTEDTKVEKTPQQQFIENFAPAAQQTQKETGVPASVTMAQAILESEWGKSKLATEGNNFFGIKASENSDQFIEMSTSEWINGESVEVKAKLRMYQDIVRSFVDHGQFLLGPRYKAALEVKDKPDEYAMKIHQAGYATDPEYANKLIALMQNYNLYQFDS